MTNKMICECNKKIIIGRFITKLGNEIEYEECEDCGLIAVNDHELPKD